MSQIAKLFDSTAYGPAPEAPDAAFAWLDDHKRKFDLFMNNQWVAPKIEKYFESRNPANGQELAQIANAGNLYDLISSKRKL
jgi:aldehyde dehydrogenase (NAD+)